MNLTDLERELTKQSDLYWTQVRIRNGTATEEDREMVSRNEAGTYTVTLPVSAPVTMAFDRAKALIGVARAAERAAEELENTRRGHTYDCDDADDPICRCGAMKHNARIDALIRELRGQP